MAKSNVKRANRGRLAEHDIGVDYHVHTTRSETKPKEGKDNSTSMRRVVTGHDANGRAVVKIDEVSKT